jgi:hypothetical protein
MQVYNLTSGEVFVDAQLSLPDEKDSTYIMSASTNTDDRVNFYIFNRKNTSIHQINYDY